MTEAPERPSRLPSRRRFLQLSAAAVCLGLGSKRALAEAAPFKAQWQGTALGAEASLTFYHPERQRAETLIRQSLTLIRALEGQFSLFRRDSALVRLNRDRVLPQPSPDMLALLDQAAKLHHLSHGRFDVTVQPLWQLYGRHFASGATTPPSGEALHEALSLVGMDKLRWDEGAVQLTQPGMALTFNGIAQGYITDRVTDFLKAEGLSDTLVNMGEYRALGGHPDGGPWRLGIDGSDTVLALDNQAVATSQGQQTAFDASGRYHHLFDPLTGVSAAEGNQSVSVIAPTATLADGLSTALAVLPAAAGDRLVASLPGVRVLRAFPA